MLQRFQQGPPPAVQKLNALIDEVNRLSRTLGDGTIQIHNTPAGRTISLNINALRPRIPHAGGGGVNLRIFEVQDTTSCGDGVYRCYEQTLDATEWAGTGGDDKFVAKDATYVEVLNLMESYPNATYARGLAKLDFLQAYQILDDEGTSRWIGTPLNGMTRLFKTTEAATANEQITCNAMLRDGSEAGAGDILTSIEVTIKVANGGVLNEGTPRIENNELIVATYYRGTWYGATIFQTTEDCVCTSP